MGTVARRIFYTVIVMLLSAITFGSGVASAADPYIGKTYGEVAASIAEKNGTAVVSTVSGDQLQTDDCIVMSWRRSKFLNTSGKNDRGREFLFHLNCNNGVASGKPGNSVTSTAGAAAKKEQETATKIAKDPTWCQKTDSNLEYCRKICDRTGLCEV